MPLLREAMESGWKSSWLARGCSARKDGVWVDIIMVACDVEAAGEVCPAKHRKMQHEPV